MARRLMAGLVTAMLTASLLVFGGAGPAQARIGGVCGSIPYHLEVFHEQRMFHYYVGADRDKNNVNIRIYDSSGVKKWDWDSPDDRKGHTWYHIQPSIPVPFGGIATFTAIFDRSGLPDPSCTYETKPCCTHLTDWSGNGTSGPWGVSPPYLSRPTNTHQVRAELPGHSSFEYVVKTSGISDAHYHNQPSFFTVPQSIYGGRTVRVIARAEGSPSHPWSFRGLKFAVPALPPPPPPPCEPIPPQITCETPGAIPS